MIVYKITNTLNGKCYIGMTSKPIMRRWKAHLTQMRQGNPRTLYNAFRKYGFVNFTIEQIDCANTAEELGELEKKYIAQYNSFGSGGYNMCSGGLGPLGLVHSEETRNKIKAAVKNKPPITEETRNKIKLGLVGHKLSKESIEKRTQKLRGQSRSELQKNNMSVGRAGKGLKNESARKHPKEIVLRALDLLKQDVPCITVSKLTGLHQSYLSRLSNNKRGVSLQGA